ncbi:hypothetical protein UK82_24835 [Frankia sp. ACN1ag]|nr:hypothetical protein UK82_24835 [Frankia sp. ACN1ag]
MRDPGGQRSHQDEDYDSRRTRDAGVAALPAARWRAHAVCVRRRQELRALGRGGRGAGAAGISRHDFAAVTRRIVRA